MNQNIMFRVTVHSGIVLLGIMVTLLCIFMPNAQCAGDDCNDPIPIDLNTQIEGENCSYQNLFTPACQSNDAREVFYFVELPDDMYQVYVCVASDYDAVVSILTDDCSSTLFCSDDDPCGLTVECAYSNQFSPAIGPVNLPAGRYVISVDGYGSQCGSFCLITQGSDVPPTETPMPTETPDPTAPPTATQTPTPSPTSTQAPGDSCSNALPVTLNSQVTGSNCFPFTGDVLSGCQPLSDGADVWYELTLPGDVVNLNICLSAEFDSVLTLVSYDCNSELYCSDNNTCGIPVSCAVSDPGNSSLSIEYLPMVTGTYYIVVDGIGLGCGEYCLDVSGMSPPVPPNDTCVTAEALVLGGPPVTGFLYGASDDFTPYASCTGWVENNDVWYEVTSPRYGEITVNVTTHSPVQPVMLGFNSISCSGSYAEGFCDGPSNNISYNFPLALSAGDTQWIVVDGFAGHFDIQVTFEDNYSDTCDSANIDTNKYTLPSTTTGNFLPSSAGYTDDYTVGDPACTSGDYSNGPDIVWQLEVTETTYEFFHFMPMEGQDAVLYIVEDCNDINGTCVAGSDRAGPGGNEWIAPVLDGGSIYYLILDGQESADEGQGSLYQATASSSFPWMCDHFSSSFIPSFSIDAAEMTSPFSAPLVSNWGGTNHNPGVSGCGPAAGPEGIFRITNTGTEGINLHFAWDFDDPTLTNVCYLLIPDCSSMNNCVVYDANIDAPAEFVWCIAPGIEHYFFYDGETASDMGRGFVTISKQDPCDPPPTFTFTPTMTPTPTQTPTPTITPTPTVTPTHTPPINDDCDNPILLICDDPPVTGSLFGATDDYTGPAHCPGWIENNDVWYVVNIPRNGQFTVHVNTINPSDLVMVNVARFDCWNLQDILPCAGPSNSITLTPPGNFYEGQDYRIIVDGSSGLFDIQVTFAGDQHSDRCDSPNIDDNTKILPAFGQSWDPYPSTVGYTDDYTFTDPACTGADHSLGPDIVYKLEMTETTFNYFTGLPYGHDMLMYIVEDCNDIDGTCLIGSNQTGTDGFEWFATVLNAGQIYYLILDGLEFFDSGATAIRHDEASVEFPDTCGDCDFLYYSIIDAALLPEPFSAPFITDVYASDEYSGTTECGQTAGPDGVFKIVNSGTEGINVNFQWQFDNALLTNVCYLLVPDCTSMNNTVACSTDTGAPASFTWCIAPGVEHYFIFDGETSLDAGRGIITISSSDTCIPPPTFTPSPTPTMTPTATPVPSSTPTPNFCELDCPPGAIPEPEPCGDNENDGCFGGFGDPHTPILCGDLFCGTMYTTGVDEDIDEYELILDEYTLITVTGDAEIPYEFGIRESRVPGSGDCFDLLSGGGYQSFSGYCSPTTRSAILPPGIHWIFIEPDEQYTAGSYPCPGPWEYWLQVDCAPAPVDACCLPDGSCVNVTLAECDELGGWSNPYIIAPCASVNCPPAVTNDECDTAIYADLPVIYNGGNNLWATDSLIPSCGSLPDSPWRDVWFEVVGNGNQYTATTCTSTPDYWTAMSVFCNSCDGFVCVEYNDSACFRGSTVTWCTESGTTYYVSLGSQYPYTLSYLVKDFGFFDLEITDSGVPCGNPVDCFPPCIHHGDVDYSGDITAGDAQKAFEITVGLHTPVFLEICAADCNNDGSITAGDAQRIFGAIFGGSCDDPII